MNGGKIKAWLIIALLVAVIIFSAAGILLWNNISKTPQVSVSSVDYRIDDKITLFGVEVPTKVTLLPTIRVSNPNIIPVTISGANYQLYLNGVPVGNGTLSEPVELKARANTTFTSEVGISRIQAVKGVIEAYKTKTIKAKIDGIVYVQIPLIGSVPIPLSQEVEVLKFE